MLGGGPAADFEAAFRIAARAGLLLAPHGGELVGPPSVTACLDRLHADRIGHGVRSIEGPAVVERLAKDGVTLEVCPVSNVALGVAPGPAAVPVRPLFEAGVRIALGADDPLLFGPRLVSQYEIARDAHGFSRTELAELARMSILGSTASPSLQADLQAGIDDWLTAGLLRHDRASDRTDPPGAASEHRRGSESPPGVAGASLPVPLGRDLAPVAGSAAARPGTRCR